MSTGSAPNPLSFLPKQVAEMLGTPMMIGLFVQEWGKQERWLGSIIAKLEGRPYEERMLELLDGQIAGYGVALDKALSSLDAASLLAQRLVVVRSEHARLADVRNDIVHGWWASLNEDGEYILRRKPRRQPETARPYSAAQLAAHFTELQALGRLIVNALRLVRGEEEISFQ